MAEPTMAEQNESGSDTTLRHVQVVFSRRNIREPFTYRYRGDRDLLGKPVVVPLGPSLTVGIVVDVETRDEVDGEVKPVRDVLDDYQSIPCSLVELGHWIAEYYVAPVNKVFESILPPKFLPSPTTAWTVETIPDADGVEVPTELVDALDPAERVRLSDLAEGIDANQEQIKEAMYSLEEQGYVEETLVLDRPEVSRRELNYVERRSGPTPDALTEKERECLEYLDKHGDQFQRDLPESLRRSDLLARLENKECVERTTRVVRRNPLPEVEEEPPDTEVELTDEQQQVIEDVQRDWQTDRFGGHLIHGVTGSGKTEVYFRLAEQTLERGETVLVLVPEITLAAFMVRRFRQRFGDELAVLHSGLSAGERRDEWSRIHNGEADLVLGVQSAVFAPLEEIGLVVVDEEHDTSYKAGSTPRYHARDVAIKRAQQTGVPVVLGSATPSLESYSNALRDRYNLLEMTERPLGGELPDVRILDLRNEDSPVNQTLVDRTRTVLDDGRKAIWFLNRRGHSNFLLCEDCGEVVQCNNCNVSLTYHSNPKRLRCHYCGYARGVPDRCPSCGGSGVERVGLGTQRLETLANKVFDGGEIIRMDSDTVTKKQARFKLLRQFGEAESALLIGTQMVTKGLDFGGVDFVGVLNVDTGLHLPDFRAAEHTFQQLVQVCGRAGRERAGGNVLVQTYNPGHYAIQMGARQSYETFFRKECAFRKPLDYPPYCRLINMVAEGRDEDKVSRELHDIHDLLSGGNGPDLLGPAPCGIDYADGKHRWHLMARGRFSREWRSQLRRWVVDEDHDTSITLDVDPVDVM